MNFNTSGGGGCQDITVELTLDDYGSETTWTLVDAQGNEVLSGGPYQDNQNGTVITETTCLENACYTLEIEDSYGDGICCNYGEGELNILDADGTVVASLDGAFGSSSSLDFCVGTSGFRTMGVRKDPKKQQATNKKKSN